MGNDIKNQYQLIDPIGSSRFGIVYKSKIKDKEEYRALRIIEREKIEDFNKINNYINHFQVCEGKNNNSVKLYEAYGSGNKIVIVMELCDENLMELFKRKKGKFIIKELYNILIQLNNTFKIMSKEKIIPQIRKYSCKIS